MKNFISLFCNVIVVCFLNSCSLNENIEVPIDTSTLKMNFVIMGSSTANGFGSTDDYSWAKMLSKKYYNSKFYNLAVNGYSTYHIMPNDFNTNLPRSKQDFFHNATYALTFKPDVVIISMTNNDIANGYLVEGEYVKNIKTLVEYLHSNGVKFVYVTTTFPRENVNFDSLFLARKLIIENFNTSSVNIFDALCDKSKRSVYQTYQYGDGIHVNNKGHFVIFTKIDEKIKTLLQMKKENEEAF